MICTIFLLFLINGQRNKHSLIHPKQGRLAKVYFAHIQVVGNLKHETSMIDDLKKSFNEIIYERTTSPFYGTLITSWIIWNWKILYLTFFVSEKRIKGTKIDYIIENFSCINHIVIYPIISTIVLLTLIPFVSNGAFWLSLRFSKWKVDQKNIVEKKQLLSLEQSIELREEIAKQEERFAKLVESKNLEISQLKLQLDSVRETNPQITLENILPKFEHTEESETDKLAERIKTTPRELKQFEIVLRLIQSGYQLSDRTDVESKFIALLESYDLIENKGNGVYKFTENGRKFQKQMLK